MLNMVQLIGRLGRNPDIRPLPSGDMVANISLATTERWSDRNTGEIRERTEWHRVAFFGKLAEVAQQHLKKGSLIYVGGRLRTHAWSDGDGVERHTTDVRGETLRMLNSPQNSHRPSRAPSPGTSARPHSTDTGSTEVDDIPF